MGNISKTTFFSYDDNHPYNLRELNESASENTNVITRLYYPYDNVGGNITSEMRNLLLNNKRYNYVIQKEVNNNNSIKTQQTTYKSWGNRTIKPLSIFENNIKQMEYKYNSMGRMIQYVGRDEIPVSII